MNINDIYLNCRLKIEIYIEDITRRREDMNFNLFSSGKILFFTTRK